MLRNLLLLVVLTLQLLTSCYYSHPVKDDKWMVNSVNEIDSVEFFINHNYWKNYFFQATETIELTSAPGYDKSYLSSPYNYNKMVEKGDAIGVMNVRIDTATVPATIWVNVARDQQCQGWVNEQVLMKKVVPDSPISKFIYHFSDRSFLVVLSCIVIALLFYLVQAARHKRIQIVHFNDICSFYPTLLCLTVSFGAVLYGTIQCYAPETWVEYYFHPTLNPFNPNLPFILSLFLTSVWMMLLVGIAVVDDLLHLPDFTGGLSYLAGLAGVCMVLYLLFTLTVHIYIGYPLLLAYWAFAFYRHFKKGTPHYCCGKCGAPISKSGKCPECGANNEI